MNDEMSINKHAENDDALGDSKEDTQWSLCELPPDVQIDEEGKIAEIISALVQNAKDELSSGAPSKARLRSLGFSPQHVRIPKEIIEYLKKRKLTLKQLSENLHTFARHAKASLNDLSENADINEVRIMWDNLRTILFPIPWVEEAVKTEQETRYLNVIGRFAEYLALTEYGKITNDKTLTDQEFAKKILEFSASENLSLAHTHAIFQFREHHRPYGFDKELYSSLRDSTPHESTKTLYEGTLNLIGALLMSEGVLFSLYQQDPLLHRKKVENKLSRRGMDILYWTEKYQQALIAEASTTSSLDDPLFDETVLFQPGINMTPNPAVAKILDEDPSIETVGQLLTKVLPNEKMRNQHLYVRDNEDTCKLDSLLSKLIPAPDIRVFSRYPQLFLRTKQRLLKSVPEKERLPLLDSLNSLQRKVLFTRKLKIQLTDELKTQLTRTKKISKKQQKHLQERLDICTWQFIDRLEQRVVNYKDLEDNPPALGKQILDAIRDDMSVPLATLQQLRKYFSRHLLDDDMNALLKQYGQGLTEGQCLTIEATAGGIVAYLMQERIPYERYCADPESHEIKIERVFSAQSNIKTFELIRNHLAEIANERIDVAQKAREVALADGQPSAAIATLLYELRDQAVDALIPLSSEIDHPVTKTEANSNLSNFYDCVSQARPDKPANIAELFDRLASLHDTKELSDLPEEFQSLTNIQAFANALHLTQMEWEILGIQLFRLAKQFELKEKDFGVFKPLKPLIKLEVEEEAIAPRRYAVMVQRPGPSTAETAFHPGTGVATRFAEKPSGDIVPTEMDIDEDSDQEPTIVRHLDEYETLNHVFFSRSFENGRWVEEQFRMDGEGNEMKFAPNVKDHEFHFKFCEASEERMWNDRQTSMKKGWFKNDPTTKDEYIQNRVEAVKRAIDATRHNEDPPSSACFKSVSIEEEHVTQADRPAARKGYLGQGVIAIAEQDESVLFVYAGIRGASEEIRNAFIKRFDEESFESCTALPNERNPDSEEYWMAFGAGNDAVRINGSFRNGDPYRGGAHFVFEEGTLTIPNKYLQDVRYDIAVYNQTRPVKLRMQAKSHYGAVYALTHAQPPIKQEPLDEPFIVGDKLFPLTRCAIQNWLTERQARELNEMYGPARWRVVSPSGDLANVSADKIKAKDISGFHSSDINSFVIEQKSAEAGGGIAEVAFAKKDHVQNGDIKWSAMQEAAHNGRELPTFRLNNRQRIEMSAYQTQSATEQSQRATRRRRSDTQTNNDSNSKRLRSRK